MAKSNSERQRKFREDQKRKRKSQSDSTDPAFKKPFFEYYGDDGNAVTLDIAMDAAGLPWLEFDDDSGPKPRTEYIEASDYADFKNSLGRAEYLIGCFLDAATVLAGIVRDYKETEIDARVAEIEAADLTDPAIKKKALADIAKLTKFRDELAKSVRWTLPQWKVKGE